MSRTTMVKPVEYLEMKDMTKAMNTPLMEGPPSKTYRTKTTTETPVAKPPAHVKPPVSSQNGETPEIKSQDHENMKFYLLAAMSGIVGLGIYFFK